MSFVLSPEASHSVGDPEQENSLGLVGSVSEGKQSDHSGALALLGAQDPRPLGRGGAGFCHTASP